MQDLLTLLLAETHQGLDLETLVDDIRTDGDRIDLIAFAAAEDFHRIIGIVTESLNIAEIAGIGQ